MTVQHPVEAADPASARQRDILAAVKTAFIDKGFDRASMQDLARAAGMSAGNFYRYFPSKAAIISAIVEAELQTIEAQFRQVLAGGALLEGLREALLWRMDNDCASEASLWSDMDSAAARQPEIAAICNRIENSIVDYITSLFAAVTGLSDAEASRRFAGHAVFILSIFKLTVARCGDDSPRALTDAARRSQMRSLVLRAIDACLADVAAAAKGATS